MISSDFELEIIEIDTVKKCSERYNNFELIYILNGEGTLKMNGKSFCYDPKNFFVFVPGDDQSLVSDETTTYASIRFTELFFTENENNQGDHREWYAHLECMFHNFNQIPGCVMKDDDDRFVVRTLVEAIIKEFEKNDPNKLYIIRNLLFSVLTLAARNISTLCVNGNSVEKGDQRIVKLLNHIQSNIHNPDKLAQEYLAREFAMSKNYLSEYFKKETGQTLKKYIQQYRVRLIKARLNYSSKSISEIAWEFNFTDLSHFNKVFKKEFNISPSAFRKEVLRRRTGQIMTTNKRILSKTDKD
jgi:AraC-like DNA-binding protein